MFEQMLELVLLVLGCWGKLMGTVNTVSVVTSLRSWPGLHFCTAHSMERTHITGDMDLQACAHFCVLAVIAKAARA